MPVESVCERVLVCFDALSVYVGGCVCVLMRERERERESESEREKGRDVARSCKAAHLFVCLCNVRLESRQQREKEK